MVRGDIIQKLGKAWALEEHLLQVSNPAVVGAQRRTCVGRWRAGGVAVYAATPLLPVRQSVQQQWQPAAAHWQHAHAGAARSL